MVQAYAPADGRDAWASLINCIDSIDCLADNSQLVYYFILNFITLGINRYLLLFNGKYRRD